MSTFLRVAAWIIALSLVALPVVAVLQGWIGADRWPLRTLRVGGQLERVDEQKLREAVLPYARKGFFAIRLDQAQSAVDKLPWVDHAEVRKHWPDVVEVRIVEHRPFARWGDDQLLSEDGDLFPIVGADVPKSLPRFDVDAPAARTADVVELYNEATRMFAPEGMRVRKLSLDRRGSWSLLLSNGTRVMVGSQEARLRLARFARLMPNLLARNPQHLARADLRYTNGFALTWGEEDGSDESAGGSMSSRAQRGISPRGLRRTATADPSLRSGWQSGGARRNRASEVAHFPIPNLHSRFPAFPNPQSPIPNPGPQT